jgi:hypothetical protein
VFRASLPPILSAVRFSGDGGMRVQFDIPETDLGEATKLLLWKGTVLRVTVEPEKPEGYGHERKWDKWDTRGE